MYRVRQKRLSWRLELRGDRFTDEKRGRCIALKRSRPKKRSFEKRY
jgi:hypothetical protein